MNVGNVQTVQGMMISATDAEPAVPVQRFATAGKAVPTVQPSARAAMKPAAAVKQ